MDELIGVMWGDLSEETREQLFGMATVWDDVKDGDCIYDINERLSVRGYVKCINKSEGDYEYIIPNTSIIYCPEEGIIDSPKLECECKINEVMTINEAAEKWGMTEGAIRAAIKTNKFIVGVEYRKAGRITLITREAMKRVYGNLK